MRWDDYYALQDSIDVIILGSSHAFRSYHPETMEAELGENTTVFNFGSAAQTPVTSYFILQEVLEKHRPKTVIFDIYIMVYTSDDQLDNGRYNYWPMAAGATKKQFLQEGFSFQEKIQLLGFPSYVYRDHFKHKMNKLFGRSYLPIGKGEYGNKGFAFNTDTLKLGELQYANQFSRFEVEKDKITAKNMEYTRKIVEKCRENGVEVVFMSSPMPELSVQFIEEYPAIYAHFDSLAQTLNVPYIDFNIDRIESLKDTEHYFDDDHMNLAGAKEFSKIAAQKIGQD